MSADDEIEMAIARLARIVPGSSRRRTLKDRIHAMMPAIEEARGKDLSWKEIHAEIVAAGIAIEPPILANYVCEHRRQARLDSAQDGHGQNETSYDPVVVTLRRRGIAGASSAPLQFRQRRAGETPPTPIDGGPASAPADDNSYPAPVPDQGADQYVETLNSDRPTKVSRPK